MRIVKVPEDRDGQRLDNFLFNQLKGVPKTHVYRLLRTGQVRVNGKRAKPDARVAGGDDVRIPPVRMAEPGEQPRASERSLQALSAAIVAEDRNFIALDKPSGLASHGGSGISLGAIESIRQLRPKESLELVHRLDRDTSGVLLLAKKRSALLAAQAAIREGTARKRYLALLVGDRGINRRCSHAREFEATRDDHQRQDLIGARQRRDAGRGELRQVIELAHRS